MVQIHLSEPCCQSLGVSHPNEFAVFTRICNNRGKFPVKLSEHLHRDKLDLFNHWLEAGKNMDEFLDFTMPSNPHEHTFVFWRFSTLF